MASLTRDKSFTDHAAILGSLFAGADAEALEAALKQGDLPAVCRALHIPESTLDTLIATGQEFARTFAADYPSIVEALRTRRRADA